MEIFACRGEQADTRSLEELCVLLSKRLGVACRVELSDGPWIVLDGFQTDMSITVDGSGNATSAMVQVGLDDDPGIVDRLCRALEELGWEIYGPGEDE
jgi:hypothetical protein